MSLKANGLTLALLASFIAPSAFAQTTATSGTSTTAATTTASTAPTTSTPSPATAANPTSKLTSKFSQWAGSTENATALVEGLRSGKPITLTTATTGTSGTTSGTAGTASGSTTFTPPTKPMGYGNVKIALSLAQAELARQGITEPTPTQMQTALMGGQLTTGSGATAQTSNLQGVLQMRADGMGWGKIANTMGVKLGAVMSGKANLAPTSGTTTASGTSTVAGKTHGNSAKGITTAGGTSAPSTGKGHAKAGSGIATAAGGSGGGAITTGAGKGGGHVATRAVTASGGNAGGNAHAGGGNGKIK